MISFLHGQVHSIQTKSLTLLTSGGVGYQVFTTGALLAEAKVGNELQILIHTQVREQEISLYGFSDASEKTLFEKLLSISGIGPKMAVQIVSQPIDQFSQAVEQGDVTFISQTPGVGKKLAQKIIVELKGKLDLSESGSPTKAPSQNLAVTEATEALESLGYKKHVILPILDTAPAGQSTEALIKFFLSSNA